MNEKEPELVGSYQAPVHEVETFTAKSMTEPLPGTYIYDLEQEIAGVPVLKFKGKSRTEDHNPLRRSTLSGSAGI